ncbi:MAG: hypothetical protein GY901_08045 [Actinomycetia bacterium]|nr:hypothetical protein [Actinomycetes bacterium]
MSNGYPIDIDDLSSTADADLAAIIEAAQAEQKARAVAAGDPEAIIEEGFARGFNAKGHAFEPWLTDSGLIVCPGSIVEKSAMSHTCRFAHLDDAWVWACQDLVLDEVRRIPDKARTHQKSVSLIPSYEGLEFDVITCKTRNGVHEMQSTTSYIVAGGILEVVATRSPKVAGHR